MAVQQREGSWVTRKSDYVCFKHRNSSIRLTESHMWKTLRHRQLWIPLRRHRKAQRSMDQWVLYEVTEPGQRFSAALKCSTWLSCTVPAVLRHQESRDELHPETCNFLFPLLPSLCHLERLRENKNPFASLRVLPHPNTAQVHPSWYDRRSKPRALPPSIFSSDVPPFFFFSFIYHPKCTSSVQVTAPAFFLVQGISISDGFAGCGSCWV